MARLPRWHFVCGLAALSTVSLYAAGCSLLFSTDDYRVAQDAGPDAPQNDSSFDGGPPPDCSNSANWTQCGDGKLNPCSGSGMEIAAALGMAELGFAGIAEVYTSPVFAATSLSIAAANATGATTDAAAVAVADAETESGGMATFYVDPIEARRSYTFGADLEVDDRFVDAKVQSEGQARAILATRGFSGTDAAGYVRTYAVTGDDLVGLREHFTVETFGQVALGGGQSGSNTQDVRLVYRARGTSLPDVVPFHCTLPLGACTPADRSISSTPSVPIVGSEGPVFAIGQEQGNVFLWDGMSSLFELVTPNRTGPAGLVHVSNGQYLVAYENGSSVSLHEVQCTLNSSNYCAGYKPGAFEQLPTTLAARHPGLASWKQTALLAVSQKAPPGSTQLRQLMLHAFDSAAKPKGRPMALPVTLSSGEVLRDIEMTVVARPTRRQIVLLVATLSGSASSTRVQVGKLLGCEQL